MHQPLRNEAFTSGTRPEAHPKAPTGARRRLALGAKRGIDVSLALLGLVSLAPLYACIYVLVRASSPGPAFYAHQRVGRNGRSFGCLKFRTMVADGDAVLAEHLAANPDQAAEWEATRKLHNDPRVTPLGAVLRQTSIDELPQLLNVLLGHMSLVGPRPVTPDELSYYGATVSAYLAARPGLTGLWQVSGRSDLSYAERVAIDEQYFENQSLLLDMWIIMRTVPIVLRSRGSR